MRSFVLRFSISKTYSRQPGPFDQGPLIALPGNSDQRYGQVGGSNVNRACRCFDAWPLRPVRPCTADDSHTRDKKKEEKIETQQHKWFDFDCIQLRPTGTTFAVRASSIKLSFPGNCRSRICITFHGRSTCLKFNIKGPGLLPGPFILKNRGELSGCPRF